MAKDSIWNENLVNKLKDLYLKKEMTTVNIAKELGFTKNAIIGKIHRLNLNSLKDNKVDTNSEKVKKELTKVIKPTKGKTVVTFKDDLKSVVNIAKKSNTVIDKSDIPFVVDEGEVDIVNSVEISKKKTNTSEKIIIKENIKESIDNIIENLETNNININVENKGKYRLVEIEANMCVWPYGDDEFTFCGERTVAGKSYCQNHLDLVYFVTKKVSKKKYAEISETEIEIDEEADTEEEIEVEIEVVN